jgi:serine/threonine protein phosphatase PrpC
MTARWQFACRAMQGGRDYQEDSAAVWVDAKNLAVVPDADDPETGALGTGTASQSTDVETENFLAILADGMGGHVGGAEASSTACRSFADGYGRAQGDIGARLAQALDAANDAIVEAIDDRPSLAGMGCTLIGVSLSSKGLDWVSVGDSLLFLFANDELTAINENHSLGPMLDQLVEDGQMSAEEAAADPRRHHLLSAVMGSPLEYIDLSGISGPRQPGDIVILASDGIETLSHEDIADVIGRNKNRDAMHIADTLLEAVIAAGHPYQDNTTLVVVRALPLS